ncbi:hypothetical protein BGZ58_008077 [Dissophora ornata]|nr:hypothetical protein BGZ58_008077 [Dissophora ornata]
MAANGHQPTGSEAPSPFFMKPLTHTPDYRFNLYVKGLDPTMTTRGLYELFKPYGNILACKTISDTETGSCRGGFVLFDNQESCAEARRAFTQQGLYVTIAHESASIKSLPVEISSPDIKPEVPEFDSSEAFPSLPSKPAKKKPQKKKISASKASQAPSTTSLKSPIPPQQTSNQADSTQSNESNESNASNHLNDHKINGSNTNGPSDRRHEDEICLIASTELSNDLKQGPSASSPRGSDTNGGFILGQSYLDFDSGFIGTHHQYLSEGYNNIGGFERSQSFLNEKPYMSVDDIDRYMNMLEINTASAVPQVSANMDDARQPIHANGAHISNTTIDDFMLEDRPRRDSTLHFDNLPEGLKYQELFELCAQYGSLILTSVDIRYINEECFGQGRVTFESHRDSTVAMAALMEKNYVVRHGETVDIYPTEPGIDDHLYDQYYQQHQDLLRLNDLAPYGMPDETLANYQLGFLQTTPGNMPFAPQIGESDERDHLWETPIPDHLYHYHANMRGESNPSPMDVDVEIFSQRHEKLSMLGISPQPISLSPASSSSSSLQPSHEWAEPSSEVSGLLSSEDHLLHELASQNSGSDPLENLDVATACPGSSSKLLSYSDIVKVPPKPTLQHKDDLSNHDLKRRGNTNKSLDEKEYRLNLFLKNLEPTMDEFKLYELCVQFGPVMSCRTITTNHGVCTGLGFVMYMSNESVDRAIQGLGELGYHAEVAVQSATNKLRCKTLSDMLFIQNIPPHIKENKLRDLFRPYALLMCHILRDPKTGKSRGVGFLKMKDTKVAERFIEEYHGRVLGKDWKLPLQASPAKP